MKNHKRTRLEPGNTMGNFDSYLTQGRSDFFHMEDYQNENYLMATNMTQALNMFGICFRYYVRTYDTSYDRVWAEDNNSHYTRYFDFMGIFELPTENKFFAQFGIKHDEDVSLYSTKLHMRVAAQDPVTKIEYIPKIGDLIEHKSDKFIYEITSIPKITDFTYFKSANLMWEFTLKPFKEQHITADDSIDGTTLAQYANSDSDLFDIRNIVDSKKEDVLYTPKAGEESIKNPYATW